MGTSTSTVPAFRSRIRTGPKSSRTSIISRLVASITAVKQLIPSTWARALITSSSDVAEAPALPVVDDRDGHLGHIRVVWIADIAGYPQPGSRLLVQRDHRLVVVMVDLGQSPDRRFAQLGAGGQEPPVARFGAETLEPAEQELAVGAMPLPYANVRAVAERDWRAESDQLNRGRST